MVGAKRDAGTGCALYCPNYSTESTHNHFTPMQKAEMFAILIATNHIQTSTKTKHIIYSGVIAAIATYKKIIIIRTNNKNQRYAPEN